MNFYAAQDSAKKKTKYLVLLYVLILLVLTGLSTLVILLLFPLSSGQSLIGLHIFNEENLPTLLGVGAFVMGGAFISSFVKSRHLSKGGAVIAASLGGIRLSPNSDNINERKALNVVEEMAIASGMPVPEVFVLRKEKAINAFAAGQSPQDAVIGLTQGCIDKLSRTQLQGVVGHEFSHILNGDMRLNLRIIMLLHGIEFIGLLGRILTSTQRNRRYSSSSRSKSKSNGALILVGVALRIIGWFGILFGNMLQAAVSRQREFLADASSVQFTRDPDAIAGALKVIGGVSESSRLKNTDSQDVAHMFFGQSFKTRLAFLFATHPPVDLRIRRIEPGWDGQYLKPQVMPAVEPVIKNSNNLENMPQPLAMLMAAGILIDQLNEVSKGVLSELVKKAQDPMEAMALVIAVLICEESTDSQDDIAWKALIQSSSHSVLEPMINQQLKALLAIDLENRLPLVELTMPALKTLSEEQYQTFKGLLQNVMDLDNQQSIFEQSAFLLITRYLDVHFGLVKVNRVRYKKAKHIVMELQLVFSILVHYGHNNSSKPMNKLTMNLAFSKAMNILGLANIEALEISEQQQNLFERATEKLAYCSDELKQKIVQALVACVEHDGQVEPVEKELVLAIAATMNAPIPRLSL